ncbi:MAG: nucleotidyl transferase AbiEii/AbiGii toxin family protein [Bacteroides sp.]|nr:nucleotidyl transferase AbiEii/AbiGii toxin family protein [Bacteroides sp.]MCM1086097.1 nucleotidyl transferase AbiEii/AbiGii toxin family protein [Bacteroides sp.]MCM1168430.1 nucleotidyl transferase AbiEii/AbiGii toxin family protein [Bacteroides sp.]
MHTEILNNRQRELLPLISGFRREYYLVGGTAIALHIGHRRSIDFDLFKNGRINHKKNLDKIEASGFPATVTRRVEEQMNLIVNEVKITFFEYPFDIEAGVKVGTYARIPSLLDLAAMKAYAMGRRSKWKDYVDLCFIFKDHHSLGEVSVRAKEIFGELFSEKLFRSQLSYFEDIDYTEEVDFILPNSPTGQEIKDYLADIATRI